MALFSQIFFNCFQNGSNKIRIHTKWPLVSLVRCSELPVLDIETKKKVSADIPAKPSSSQHLTYLDNLTGETLSKEDATKHGLITGEEDELDDAIISAASIKYRKPLRPCMYCNRMQSHLRRHMITRHRNHDDVKAALLLPKSEQTRHFELLRKQSIFEENRKRLKNTKIASELLQERRHGKSDVDMCRKCKGFYKSSVIWKHMLRCSTIGTVPAEGISLSHIDLYTNDEEFKNEVLMRFHCDNAGQLCMTDPMIKTIGKIIWGKCSKQDGKSTMGEMRKLALLLLACNRLAKQPITGYDMLNPNNFRLVVDALNDITARSKNGIKSSLKISLGYLLKKAAHESKREFIIDGKDDEVQKLDRFSSLLASSWGYIFNFAQCQIESNRKVYLQCHQKLRVDQDIIKLRDYIQHRVAELIDDKYLCWSIEEFVELCSLLVCHLTLYNGRRRGSEPARLLLKEWIDADMNTGVTPAMIGIITDPVDKAFGQKFNLIYQRGKGSGGMVQVLIPINSISAIHKLVEKRDVCGILADNPYLFPHVNSSDRHEVKWQTVKNTCRKAGLSTPAHFTAIKLRRRISIRYSQEDVLEKERKAFYKNVDDIGSMQVVHESVYQCPDTPVVSCKVGPFPHGLDSDALETTISSGIYIIQC